MMPRHAYVTLVTNADYALGATALVRSLKLSGTGADVVVMHTGGVDRAELAPLEALGARLVAAELLPTSEMGLPREAIPARAYPPARRSG